MILLLLNMCLVSMSVFNFVGALVTPNDILLNLAINTSVRSLQLTLDQ
jgi:hypothetical protein